MLFEDPKDIKVTDQAAHFAAGLLGTAAAATQVTVVYAGILVLAFAIIREIFQHPLQCGKGCRTDLLFWVLGIVLGGTLVSYF